MLGCNQQQDQVLSRFSLLNMDRTGVDFVNRIKETEQINYFTYPYLYMGGGVGIIDVNNDGLQDLYFTSNMESNKLYLNKGNMQFEDITDAAGVAGDERWDTGVAIADFNGDGLQDIYVSVSGIWESTENLFFINNGDLTFTEKANELGLADQGNSTQASLIDFDRDGDLDVYVTNYPPTPFKAPNFVYHTNLQNPSSETSDHLYRNDQGVFTDVTSETIGYNFGLSLSAAVADFNNDGWPDIYVSNDFASPDFLYINNQDGTFVNEIQKTNNHTAFYGMGTDAADFNNDGLIDFFQADMTPAGNFRSKANMAGMNPAGFWEMVDFGLHFQYMENALNLNHGINEEGIPRFGDVSRMTGTALTDWSWSPLWVDLDNDGLKDLHVTNGTRRDINNKDYFNQFKKTYFTNAGDQKETSLLEKSLGIPSRRIDNYVFKNVGDLGFDISNDTWGLSFDGFSNGSAFADLDNDGDMDLVVNNIDDPASVFQNNSVGNNWLQISLQGMPNNPFGQGSRVTIKTPEDIQMVEIYSSRGFQSSSQPTAHFGLGKGKQVLQVIIEWPDGSVEIRDNVVVNQHLTIQYKKGGASPPKEYPRTLFKEVSSDLTAIQHQENEHDDFKDEVLLPHATSRFGPFLATGDVNGDDLADVFVGGASGQSSTLLIQMSDGTYLKQETKALEDDRIKEDMGALFFDADGDGDDDLYVVSGGNEKEAGAMYYQDRLYINEGGSYVNNTAAIPVMNTSGSKVLCSDFDHDGDLDLVIGGRLSSKNYGIPAKTTLLRNDSQEGNPSFKDVTAEVAPELENVGMVTDLLWLDMDQDGWQDLILVGEWMPVTYFHNATGKLIDETEKIGWKDTHGWWFSVAAADFNKDGQPDLVVGNVGTNYKYQASEEEPFELYVNDFDQNGSNDLVLGYYNEGKKFPVRGRQCSSEQMPFIKKKFADYNSFASAELETIYGTQNLASAQYHYEVKSFESMVLISDQSGYQAKPLPAVCQVSSINAIAIADFNTDGQLDILTAGNLYSSEVETKRNDASIGQLLLGDGRGDFDPVPYKKSGFMADGDVKDIIIISHMGVPEVLVARNNDTLKQFKINNYLNN